MIKKKYLLIIFSIFVGLFITEILFQLIFANKKKYTYAPAEVRFMLFDEPDGEVFDVYENFFKYKPNKQILAETFFKIDNEFKKEYSYILETNNFGLVQEKNISKNRKSILLLGASFIEGQGASSWVNNLTLDDNELQIINGGILGTGPQQMENLEKHISNNFNVEKLIFFYVGEILRRDPFTIENNTINCLKNYQDCKGNENFYGFPLSKKDPKDFLLYLDNYRTDSFKKIDKFKHYRRLIKKKISELYIVNIPLNLIRNSFYKSKNVKIKKNFTSMKNLIQKYQDNIYFVQMLTRYQIGMGKSYETILTENFLLEKNVNHYMCNFEYDLSNFYPNDGHPNQKGYESLKNCVQKILNRI